MSTRAGSVPLADLSAVDIARDADRRVAEDRHGRARPADLPAFRGDGAPGRRRLALVALAWLALVLITLPIGAALGDSTALDRSAADWFVEHRSDGINALSRVFSLAGDTYTVIAIATLVVIIGIVRRRAEGLVVLVVGMLGEVTIFLTLTALVSRGRPDVPRLDGAPPTSSFPSGHTFAAIVLWGALGVVATRSRWHPWLRSAFLTMMVAMPIAIGLSRLSRGMHHLTDVLASVVLGVVWLTIVVKIFPPSASSAAPPSDSPRQMHAEVTA